VSRVDMAEPLIDRLSLSFYKLGIRIIRKTFGDRRANCTRNISLSQTPRPKDLKVLFSKRGARSKQHAAIQANGILGQYHASHQLIERNKCQPDIT